MARSSALRPRPSPDAGTRKPGSCADGARPPGSPLTADAGRASGRAYSLIVQISDPHLRQGAGDRHAAAALIAAVHRIGALRPSPDAVILSGDIANSGSAYEYERAGEILAALPMPVHPLPGNHDDREAMRAGFAGHPGIDGCGEFLQYEADCAGVRLLVCDTLDPGNAAGGGRLDGARCDWLGERLGERRETPTIVAMHHPPILTGMRGFDEIGLAAADHAELERLIADAPQAELIVAGHVHRGAVGALAGRRVITAPSVHLQSTLGLGPDGVPTLIEAPPGMLVHVHAPTLGFVTHIEPIAMPNP